MFKNHHGESFTLPDFIIVGAMKSGTTSLHHILNHHPDIFIADREIMFFDMDDVEQNLDFFLQTSKNWRLFDYEMHFDKYLSWYQSFFSDSSKGQIIGEDSTTYMASSKAPQRIFSLLPEVKLIFMLRDPVSRTYSHFWHLVHYGSAIYDFERTLQHMPGLLIQRSLYKKQILRYVHLFPPENLKFVIFEDFITNTQAMIDEICSFLKVKKSVDTSNIPTHRNPTKSPRRIQLQILYNHILRSKHLVAQEFASHLPPPLPAKHPLFWRKMDKLLKKMNFTDKKGYPPMNPKTKRFLQQLFKKENRGLSNIIGKNLSHAWPYMNE